MEPLLQTNEHLIRLRGIVERVTFHNAETGWSVLKVSPFNEPLKRVTVVIHQARVFAGSSMEFMGVWNHHAKHGEQFKAVSANEVKPASSAAMEKYLGSGLIKGVGPVTARKIVRHFREQTLTVFEERIDELLSVPGIAEKKLRDIKTSWEEHKSIRDVMLFLQDYGISTLYAVKIFKTYGNEAIAVVSANPYQLAKDIYGIGFFSADRIALAMGFAREGDKRIEAGIKHVLAASREEGHCYLTEEQILKATLALLDIQDTERIRVHLNALLQANEIKKRIFASGDGGYYSNTLYFDEQSVATLIAQKLRRSISVDITRVRNWVDAWCRKQGMALSMEQQNAVIGIAGKPFSILTGYPGCGKTTTTRTLVKLLLAMGKHVLLAAPTGRAAQRMSEVIGTEAKTLHRLLEWSPEKAGFKKCETEPLSADFLIVDECSMLDISLAASLLKAVPSHTQVLFIGDPDQLPSVGAGNVLFDLLQASRVPSFRLTQVFRQAQESLIIRYANQINRGIIPAIPSPLHHPQHWQDKTDCLFMDAEEVTQEQARFLHKARQAMQSILSSGEEYLVKTGEVLTGTMKRSGDEIAIDTLLVQEFADQKEVHAPVLVIPEKFKHIDLQKLVNARGDDIAELNAVLKSVHPWSALHYGMTALDVVLRLYTRTIPEYFGRDIEIQVLTPQTRGSLGTVNLNTAIQNAVNPERKEVRHITIGERIYRTGDRVIQMRNNYDLGVYNGDIGRIADIDLETYQCQVQFGSQTVTYEREDMTEIALAYGITIHKSQGSEFEAVIIPVASQHSRMIYRNLIYTGLTRARKLCVFVGSRKALAMAVKQIDNRKRQTHLTALVEGIEG